MNTVEAPGEAIAQTIEQVFREEHGRILATLIRIFGDFDPAEDALQEAFIAAVRHWPGEGIPANPAAWLTTTARRKALDRLRRERTQSTLCERLGPELALTLESDPTVEPEPPD